MFITNLFLAAGRAFADWRRRERAYSEMMALNDRSLADIGIQRSQIRSLIYDDPAPAGPMASAPSRARHRFARRKAA